MWIDYAAYAGMHPCSVVIMGFCAAMELLMMFMNANDGGALQRAIFESEISQALFYTMFAFGAVKLLCAFRIYKEFKLAAEGYPP